MIHFFQGISFKPKHVLVKRKALKQNLKYDPKPMAEIRKTLESIKQLIEERNEK